MKSLHQIAMLSLAAASVMVVSVMYPVQAADENGANIVAPGNINKVPGGIDENAPRAIGDPNAVGDPDQLPEAIGDPNARSPGLIK